MDKFCREHHANNSKGICREFKDMFKVFVSYPIEEKEEYDDEEEEVEEEEEKEEEIEETHMKTINISWDYDSEHEVEYDLVG